MQTNSQFQFQVNDQIKNIIEDVLMVIDTDDPVLFTGAPGIGKTTLAVHVCERLFGSYNRIDCGFISEPTDIFVQPVLDKDGLKYVKTEVALYPERPLILDELNRVQNERALNGLFSMLDDRKDVFLPQLQEYVRTPKIVIATANVGSEFVGTIEIDPAILSRFTVFHIERPDRFISKYPLIERIANELRGTTYRNIRKAEKYHERGMPIEKAIIYGFQSAANKNEILQLLEMIK